MPAWFAFGIGLQVGALLTLAIVAIVVTRNRRA